MELLRAGPYLSCIADAFLRVGRESGVSVGHTATKSGAARRARYTSGRWDNSRRCRR